MKRSRLLAFTALPFIAACSSQPVNAPATTDTGERTVIEASGPATVSASLQQTAHLSLKPTASNCQNNPGPYITLDGALRLGGINAKVILTNNERFTHETSADVVGQAVLVPAGQSIQIHKSPSRGGAGGNPWIYLVFTDEYGKSLGAPQKLGRCVQGLNDAALSFALATAARMTVTSGGCSNHPGPEVTLDGELRLGGLNAKLIFTNNARFTHVASGDVVVEIVLIPAGKSLTFNKQPPLDGAGGNPWIWVQFLSGSGQPFGDPILVGRCVQLGK